MGRSRKPKNGRVMILSVKPLKSSHLSIMYVLVPILAVLVAWATGYWEHTEKGILEYGFPLAWKTSQIIPTSASCPLRVSYNGLFFLLDVVHYIAIGYASGFLYTKVIKTQKEHLSDPLKAT